MGERSRLSASLIGLALFSACGVIGSQKLDPGEYNGVPTCGAEKYQFLLGKKETVIDGVDLPKATRILHPEDVIALDFSPDRLTIDVDGLGRISSVTCR